MKIVVTKHFGGVMVFTGLLAIQHYYTGFGLIVPYRKSIFSEEALSEFDKQHEQTYKTKPSPYGYPD